jgi:hypothetical protein
MPIQLNGHKGKIGILCIMPPTIDHLAKPFSVSITLYWIAVDATLIPDNSPHNAAGRFDDALHVTVKGAFFLWIPRLQT